MTFAERLKQVRGKLEREEFAAKIGKTARTVQRWELENGYPNGKELLKIAEEFNVDMNWLLTGQGEPYIQPMEGIKQGPPGDISGGLGRSVDMLANVLNSGNQLYIQMVLSVLSAFDSAVTHTKNQAEEIARLNKEYEELKKRVENLEATAPQPKKGVAA
jgi:transcriptional regulator with XRE-family HTH domain